MPGLHHLAAVISISAFSIVPTVSHGQGDSNAQTETQFQTVLVTTSQIGGNATIGGTVVPFKEVTLNAQIPGRVIFLAGAEGFGAAEGQVLLAISDENIQAQRRAAQAQITQAEAELRNAQMQYSRELYSPRVNSLTGIPGMGVPSTFDQFFTRGFSDMVGQSDSGLERQAELYAQGVGIDHAQSGVLQAQANLDGLDARLRDASSVAPFDGIIIEKMVEVGDTVQPGMPLLKFSYVDYLRIVADVPVRLAAGLSEGMLVSARLDAGGEQVQARVAQVFPVADQERHTVRVKFDLPKGTAGGPGMYVEVTVPDSSVPVRTQPSVPAKSLIWRGSLPSVFIIVDGKPSLRLVRVGYPLPDGRISVVSGLNGGEMVIVNPPANLVSGE